jgi:putative restriction endonuclease
LASNTGDDDTPIRHADDQLENEIRQESGLDSTERDAVVSARRGQGRYRTAVTQIEKWCRITGVSDHRLLRASHIKPWRSCANNQERLDGYNGLLLSPAIDHLFDRGYISFEDDGRTLISSKIDAAQLYLLGVPNSPAPNVGPFTKEQCGYLAYHRAVVFVTEPENPKNSLGPTAKSRQKAQNELEDA